MDVVPHGDGGAPGRAITKLFLASTLASGGFKPRYTRPCHQWQLEELSGDDDTDTAGATCSDGRRVAEVAERLATVEPGQEDTAPPIEQSTPGFANSRVRALPHVHPRGLGSRPSSLRGLNEEFYKKKFKTKKLRHLED